MDEKQRLIQEYVPGKQITLAHIISNPEDELCKKLGLAPDEKNAIGILTLTPSETTIIAADIATKAADINLVFMDRFSGTLVVCGDTESCTIVMDEVIRFVSDVMGFSSFPVTRS